MLGYQEKLQEKGISHDEEYKIWSANEKRRRIVAEFIALISEG